MRPASPGSVTRPSGAGVRSTILDVVVAVLLSWLAAVAPLDPPGPAFAGPTLASWLAGIAVGLPLAVRRRRPLPVLFAVVTAAVAATACGIVGSGVIWVTYVPVAVASYTVAAMRRPLVAVAAVAAALAATSAAIPWFYRRYGSSSAATANSEVPLWWAVELGTVTVIVTGAWVAGWVVRWRRMVRADLARRMARDAVAAEQLRIARELHDIIGHSMSLIAVKASVANHIAAERPEEVRLALGVIERTSRDALTEIRRLLGVLRSDSDAGAELSPAPKVADLADLASQLRSAGLAVDLQTDGISDLPQGVDLAVFRVVQEALTNVMKHSHAEHCRVTVRDVGGSIHIEVFDGGRGHRSPTRRVGGGGGQGVIGMRERASMYGGWLETRSQVGGGFQVVAEIPYATAEETI
ncbi:sensor histidine kinase [Pilimelia columellifera]|uniref:histidine kinase n=1 Tax=Pilimelia columellifera subsp. columellifera TaxID=706583 RepID=A0ABP6B3K9_9ACTN